ncbi:MAG: ferredoxin [Patescibacteria group bacterium]|jgi:ferredoxin|nr:ferredoxin [Patescibacteria group bacterium]MDD5172949.1 ferredoxin [Patescibacteria group bacterium]
MFKTFLDKEKCIGCGTCVAVCPANFEIDDDGKAKVIKEETETMGCNRLAEESCPVKAISIKVDKKPNEPESTEIKKE